MTAVTKTQIDRLGERLKLAEIQEEDLRLLDSYRASFGNAYDHVLAVIRDQLGISATGRQVKTTSSIVAKLHREKIRLSQMQDIAGCRTIVDGVIAQDRALDALTHVFPKARVIDRRQKPSYGYRAVHLIVSADDQLIEVQIRTQLQHLWAELSEKYAEAVDPAIKYGGGPEPLIELLKDASRVIAKCEDFERELALAESAEDHLEFVADLRANLFEVQRYLAEGFKATVKKVQAIIDNRRRPQN